MAKKLDYASLYTLRSDGRYVGSFTDEAGKRHYVYDRDPEKLYHKLDAAKHPETAPVTFKAVAEKWEGKYREEVTQRTWANFAPHYDDMVGRWGNLPVREITADMINSDLLRAKAQGRSHTVVNGRKVIITGILNQALADGEIPFNPAISVRLPKGLPQGKRTAPGNDVITAVIKHRDDPFGFFPFLLLCTGMRKSEALALHTEDIDLKAGTIQVRRSLTYIDGANPQEKLPKSGKGREISIPSILTGPLEEHLNTLDGRILFPQAKSNRAQGGGYMSEKAYEYAWAQWCAGAGLVWNGKPVITAHHLRHAAATLMFEADVDVYTAQATLGHSKVSTTMEIYTDLTQKRKMKSVQKYSDKLSELLSKSSNNA